MPKYSCERYSEFSSDVLFNLVIDIESYPEFLPWCSGAKVISCNNNVIIADLIVKYKMFRVKFSSRVTVIPGQQINVDVVSGPFRYLKNTWKFSTLTNNKTKVSFAVDFEFSSLMLDKLSNLVLNKVVETMIAAFVERAEERYGFVPNKGD